MATSACPIIYYGCRITNHSKNCYRFLFTSSCLCCIVITLPCFIYHHLEIWDLLFITSILHQDQESQCSSHTPRDPRCSFQTYTKRPPVFIPARHQEKPGILCHLASFLASLLVVLVAWCLSCSCCFSWCCHSMVRRDKHPQHHSKSQSPAPATSWFWC